MEISQIIDQLNQAILNVFPGQETVTVSTDNVTGGLMQNIYPIEFLNQKKASGLPLAHLALKPGCPLMLLRNLDVTNGLCNGTQMILLSIKNHVLECHILGGKHAEKMVFIPRITIELSLEELAVPLSRHQFPVCLAFCMTINKSQGQSIVHIGLDLRILPWPALCCSFQMHFRK
jgi:hypothetical protein